MNQKLANAAALYLEGIRDGNVRAAVETYTADRYTQHSTGVADGIDMAVFDLFHVENGLIVEHRDNSEPIPDGPQPNSGKF